MLPYKPFPKRQLILRKTPPCGTREPCFIEYRRHGKRLPAHATGLAAEIPQQTAKQFAVEVRPTLTNPLS
jgi:hypothetical protein